MNSKSVMFLLLIVVTAVVLHASASPLLPEGPYLNPDTVPLAVFKEYRRMRAHSPFNNMKAIRYGRYSW